MVIEERFVKRFELTKHNISAKLEFITENFKKNPTMNKARLTTMALVIICLSVALVSCDKNEDEPDPAVTKTSLLTKAPWKIKATGIDVDKNGTIDGFPLVVKACALDNTYTFNKNGTGTISEDALKCDPLDPQTSTFNWVFKSAETILNGDFKLAGWSGDATISVLNDTSCILYKDTLILGTSARAVVSLKH